MDLTSYTLRASANFVSFQFVSEGPKGSIQKEIAFTCIDSPFVWNLGFGDINPVTELIDDLTISDNDDRDMVLATVAQAVVVFTAQYPKRIVFATGSTPARTRLCRIGISRHFADINAIFSVWGLLNGEWCLFEKNVNYQAFAIRRNQ